MVALRVKTQEHFTKGEKEGKTIPVCDWTEPKSIKIGQ